MSQKDIKNGKQWLIYKLLPNPFVDCTTFAGIRTINFILYGVPNVLSIHSASPKFQFRSTPVSF